LGDVEAHAREVYATGRNTVKHHRGTDIFEVGNIRFGLEMRRQASGDGGLAIHVLADLAGTPGRHYTEETELLAFDCFRDAPHYHYGPENHNIRLFMDKTTAGNPLGWTINNLRKNLTVMIERSGYEDLAATLKKTPVTKAILDKVEAKAREMVRGERRTVHHMMPELVDGDKIEAGNIRFGLEYRHLPQINDEGMAIHVLSDIAGQEVELLAFDCFQGAPHYHYGPRNQDVRIYWDVTTSGETLKWTLDQFKGGKLKSMIERAGYPSIASELDENLVQAMMPKIEKRSWDLVALNTE